ncbi:MAG: hypothetical protein K0S86_2415 [Geminicoccaceae bacterium]|nr:hypothetical protein [Geminicoccaceae bacterium]
MNDLLTDVEVRVLGSLIEKEMTTPDYYPLSLNALTNACNQTSNREPVVHYDEGTVAKAIETLRVRSLVRAVQQSGSRVTKYRHLVGETMGLTARYAAVLGVLMLRGPQTLAELRTRASRLASFESLDEVESALNAMMERQPTPLVVRLPRRTGQKETRYAHVLAGEVTYDVPDAPDEREVPSSPRAAQSDRLGALEAEVALLRQEVADLRGQLEEFRRQFE